MSKTPVLIDALVLGSAVVAIVQAPRYMRRPIRETLTVRRLGGPGSAFALVTSLIYLNQLLFTIYVIRVHDGDASFIAGYLPAGWFDLAVGGSTVQAIAQHFPAVGLLSVTVLRVQAFLELPFVMLAYMTVLRWLDPGLYRRVATSPLVWAASISYTIVFCVVEWDLRNPFTTDDILIRLCAGMVTPAGIAWLARRDRGVSRPITTPVLLCFSASSGALGYIVLVVYDTALLYNPGHLGRALPGAMIALAVLAVTRALARLLPTPQAPGSGISAIAWGMRWSLVLFMVPALAVRYGVTFATPALAAGGGAAIIVTAAVQAGKDVFRSVGRPRVPALVLRLAVGTAGGLAAAYLAVRWSTDTYYEAALLRATASFFILTVIICAALDRWETSRRMGLRGDETPSEERRRLATRQARDR